MTTSVSISKYSARLRPHDVDEIRRAPVGTTHVELARRYHVTPTTIARVRRGQTWPANRGETVRVSIPSEVLAALDRDARGEAKGPQQLAAEILVRWASRRRA